MIDTTGTFIAAYVVVAVIFIGYTLSLVARARKLSHSDRAQRVEESL